LVVKLVGAEGKGILSVIQTFFGLLVAVGFLSLNSGLVFFASKSNNRTSLYNSAIVFSIYESLFFIVIVLLFSPIINEKIFNSISPEYLYYGLILIFSNSLLKVSDPYCRARNNYFVFNLSSIFQHLVYVFSIVILWDL
jgi:O-antigen/teichoic acid export membrane protein